MRSLIASRAHRGAALAGLVPVGAVATPNALPSACQSGSALGLHVHSCLATHYSSLVTLVPGPKESAKRIRYEVSDSAFFMLAEGGVGCGLARMLRLVAQRAAPEPRSEPRSSAAGGAVGALAWSAPVHAPTRGYHGREPRSGGSASHWFGWLLAGRCNLCSVPEVLFGFADFDQPLF